jgi:thioredoxin-related protein
MPLFSASQKMILLYVEMENCPWCKKMSSEIFEDSSNFTKLQKLFEIKRVKKGSMDIPPFIKTKFYPTTYILSSDNSKLIDELPGYMRAEDYLDYLQTLIEVETQ